MSEAPAPYQLAPAPLTVAERICLRRAAEAATPGLWMHVHEEGEDEPHYVAQHPGPGSHIGLHYVAEMERFSGASANATYIAEACPRTVLRLLDQVADSEARATAAEAELLRVQQELAEAQAKHGEVYGRMFSASVLTDFEQAAYQWAQGYCGYPDQLAAVIRRMQDALLPASAAPEPPQQPEPQGGGRVGVGRREELARLHRCDLCDNMDGGLCPEHNPHKDPTFFGCWGNSSCPCDSKCPEDCPLYSPPEPAE